MTRLWLLNFTKSQLARNFYEKDDWWIAQVIATNKRVPQQKMSKIYVGDCMNCALTSWISWNIYVAINIILEKMFEAGTC